MSGLAIEPRRTPGERLVALLAARTFPVYATLTGLYVLFRIGSFSNIPDRFTDTPSYEAVAHLALWNWRFYAGSRGFTIPLFFKLFQSSEARIVAQLAISTVAWIALAAAVARAVRSPAVRPAAFAVVLAFSLTTEVILWDTLLLSESLTFALCALLLAAWLELVRSPRPLWAAAVLVLSLLWVFARDTNASVLLVVALLAALMLLRGGHRGLKVALAVGCCAVFLLDYGSAEAGKRWLQPLRDVVAHRVVPSASLRPYFVAHGLDLHSNWPESTWIRNRARGVYARYLVTHPGYALAAPFHGRQATLSSTPSNAQSLLDPSIKPYDDNANHRFLPLPRVLERVLFPRGVALVLALAALAVVAAAALAAVTGLDAVWIVPLGVLVTTYPHLLVVWHQSGVEVDRHALEAALLLRLATWLGLLLAADRLVAALTSR